MVSGVARKSGKGVPACVFQEEEKKKEDIIKKKWTLKVATLKGDSSMKGLVALSLYDSKPFYLISNSCEYVKWKKKKRKVYHKQLKKMVQVPYFCLNIVDDYNMHMNSVDRADQLRGVYRWDTFMRKRKWWWSILFWVMQMLQTNAFVAYCKYMKLHDQTPITHLEFCKQIALAWLDPYNNWPKLQSIVSARARRSNESASESTNNDSGMTTRSRAI